MAQYPPPGGYPVPPMQGSYPPQTPNGYPGQAGGYPPPQIPGGNQALSTPPEIAQQAATYQLGALTQRYQANYSKLISFVGLSLVATLICIPALESGGAGILAFLLLLAATAYAVWYLVTSINVKAYVFTEGLIRTQGSKHDVMRWEHIESVLEKAVRHRYRGLITLYTSYNYTVRRGDGVLFKFSSALKNTKQLGQVMQQEVTRRQLPKAIAAYDSGSPVNFGPLSVSMQGISKNGVPVPWNQIGPVNIRRGWMIISRQGSLLAASRTRCSVIPNLQVFLQLFEHARRRANGGY